MKKNIILSSLAILLLTGCTTKGFLEEHSKYSKKQIDSLHETNKDSATNYLKNNQIEQSVKYVDLTLSKKLEDILNELSGIEDRIYMIADTRSNISVPASINSKLLNINNFTSLKNYIEDTTNHTIEVTKNKFVNNRPKIVKVLDKNSIESNFKNLDFKIDSKSSVSSALNTLSKKINFSIVYKEDLNSDAGSANMNLQDDILSFDSKNFSSEEVRFAGSSVSDFLNYIEKNFDVYTDINYEDKIIVISKYKTQLFTVAALNSKITLSDAKIQSSSTGGNSSGMSSNSNSNETDTNAVKNNLEMKGVEHFKEELKMFLQDDKGHKLIFNEDVGQVVVKTTNSNMKDIENIISQFNAHYSTDISVTIDIYEFVLNKSYNLGSDVSYSGSKTHIDTNFLNSSIINAITKVGNKQVEFSIDSNNEFIRFSKVNTISQRTSSNIPISVNIGTNENYLAKTSSTTTSNTSTTTSRDQEISNIYDGYIYTFLPRLIGNEVILKSELKINTTTELKTHTNPDGETIYMPKQDIKTLPFHNKILSGDKLVLGSYTVFEDTKNYKGAAPIEDFIIAGSSGKKWIKKEIIVVVSVNRVN